MKLSRPVVIVFAVPLFLAVLAACRPPTNSTLPQRGAFIYPWYPEAWTTPAPHDLPTQGEYKSVDQLTRQVSDLNYAHFGFAISSWWGQGNWTDQRFQPLLNATHGSSLKVAPYYEAEGNAVATAPGSPNPTPSQITADLNYIAKHYIFDSNYFWINGKPVIFAFGDATDSCSTVARWEQANGAASVHFYVVLKVFTGYRTCANQPDNWHQYGPAVAAVQQGTHSYTVSPGFYKYNETTPRLVRDINRFTSDVNAMNCSHADFQLVTTYNEWGEDTGIEPGGNWGSSYLGVLHNNTTCSTTTAP